VTCEGKIKNFNIGGTENWGQAKGAYCFFGNRKVTVEQIVKPHLERTIERILCQGEDVFGNSGHHKCCSHSSPCKHWTWE
jgi:hypothetical protein